MRHYFTWIRREVSAKSASSCPSSRVCVYIYIYIDILIYVLLHIYIIYIYICVWSACTMREPFTFLQLELWSARANDRWLVIARLWHCCAVHASACLNSRIVKTGCKAVHLPPISALFDENLHTLHTRLLSSISDRARGAMDIILETCALTLYSTRTSSAETQCYFSPLNYTH